MKISYNWLKNYIQTELDAPQVAKILTNIGLEVEGLEQIETFGADWPEWLWVRC